VSHDAADEEFEVGPKPAAPRPGLSLKARAVGLLSRREHSRAELQRKLAPHADSQEALDKVLDDLVQAGWQSDVRFTQGWLHRKASAHGTARIAQDLRLQGISAEAIAAVQSELKSSELSRAQAVWSRKFSRSADPLSPNEYARQGRFLASRGFSTEIIRRVLKNPGHDDD
jgi:regulatory protein